LEKTLRILIAEDDLTARTILSGVLKKWGYEVVAVKDGLAATTS
jgi:CheY-like chemotaxis protein